MTVPPHELRARLLTATERSLAASSDFDLNPVSKEKRTASLRDAAVLIGVYSSVDGPCVLLTRRAAHLKHHPNQVAFPGGKVEAKDAHIHAAALREAQEEVGLNPQNIDVLGSLAPHETVTGFSVTSVIGLISSPFTPQIDPCEVAEAFWVPLAHLTQVENFSIHQRRWKSQTRKYYAIPFGPYYIWGATARILRGLADRLV